ncbi:hypothetical protein T484DRAFT_1888471, partial [Baffinella frigidus]
MVIVRDAASARTRACAGCGLGGRKLQACGKCHAAWFCGQTCQKAAWKTHRKTCGLSLPLPAIYERVMDANQAGDWKGVVAWGGRMEEMLAGQSNEAQASILGAFAAAHFGNFTHPATFGEAKGRGGKAETLSERRLAVLATMGRVRDQGEAMFALGSNLAAGGDTVGAGKWFESARRLGADHGFLLLECESCAGLGSLARQDGRLESCAGLGSLARQDGRLEEGREMLEHALSVVEFVEPEDPEHRRLLEGMVLQDLIELLLSSEDDFEDAEPLIMRFRNQAKDSLRLGPPEACEGQRVTPLALPGHSLAARLALRRGDCSVAKDSGRVTPLALLGHSLTARLALRRGDYTGAAREWGSVAQLAGSEGGGRGGDGTALARTPGHPLPTG